MNGKRLLTALIVLALLLAGVGPAVAAGPTDAGTTVAPSHDDDDGTYWEKNDTEPAEEAYVTGDGDVVLVYDYTADGEVPEKKKARSGHAGVNVSAGLAHLVMEKDVETNVTGDLTMTADRESVSADGTLSAPKPDALDALQFEYVARRNDSDRAASMTLDLAATPSGRSSFLLLLQRAGTSGFVTTGPDSLESNGSFDVVSTIGMGAERSHNFVLTETDGSYALAAEESFRDRAGEWPSEADAKGRLRARYCEPFDATGEATCSVTVESFSRTGDRVSMSYTVSMNGVDGAVSTAIVDGLTGPEANVSTGEARKLADHVSNVTVERIEADFEFTGTSGSFTWNVSLADSDDLVLAYADLLKQFEDGLGGMGGAEADSAFGGPFSGGPGEIADRLIAGVRAQQAAGYTGTTTWEAELTTSGNTAVLNATLDARTTNWADYVSELEARGVNASGTSEAIVRAQAAGDRITLDASISAEQQDMFERGLARLNESLVRNADDPAKATKVAEFFDTIRAANFTTARMDADLTGQKARIEAAAAVENGSALTADLPGELSGFASSYTSFDDLETTVRLEGAVSPGADEAAVRDLRLVGDETTVHLAGDWNRNFEAMDRQRVRGYLGLTETASQEMPIPLMDVADSAVSALSEITALFVPDDG